MNGFVSLPPTTTSGPPDVVAGDGWFPDVDMVAIRNVARTDPGVTEPRLEEAVRNAMSSLADELATWRGEQEALGHTALADIPAPEYGGRSRLLSLYDRAIFETVWADLTERRRDVGTTSAGHDRADALEDSETVHRRNARWAVRDIMGLPRVTAELI